MRTLLIGLIFAGVLSLFAHTSITAAGDVWPGENGSAFMLGGDIWPGENG